MARRDRYTADLFEVPQPAAPLPASMDYRSEVAALVGQVLKNADGDRYEIAARMGRLSGAEVSKYMLDAWASEARDAYNMPFYQAPVLETACDTHAFSNWMADKRGGRLLIGREALNAELGKLERLKEDAGKKIRELKKLMGELE
ncbi:hypothetical protein [Alkalilimnicola sp. S0819]|uniref:hypothetical protein n=1 Tax=Alkalilimnicola sp. S0819 TaxID=2613922 RepID=UPI0012618B42|nr:hypothetical protein [Alkalilimnicola sp. S0819]KAB7624356.1 hypothetical protein F3N43_05990 [Alkalilimnicola sp. S0819]MPQ16182.1 hypothetical protein [Alkalilimnicola sp. S0819]